MTNRSFEISSLKEIKKLKENFIVQMKHTFHINLKKSCSRVLPLSSNKHQIRINASTHDQKGILQTFNKGST